MRDRWRFRSNVTPARQARFLAIVTGEARDPAATLARAALWWARLPVGVGVFARNTLFNQGLRRIHRVAVPVVSVGNLTLGGTGKTPCVEWIAQHYRDAGLQVALLSRGYGSESGPNDEALVLEENLPDVPHLQGRNRAELAATAVEELDSELLILDDGFQHRRLHRDLDIVLIDATQPLGDGHLFPRGLLREPLSALARAQVVIVTRATAIDRDPAASKRILQLERRLGRTLPKATHQPVELLAQGRDSEPLDTVRGKPVFGFCGVGNPESFRRTLLDLGADVRDFLALPDHHNYTRGDVDELIRRASRLPASGLALTTQKDSVKLRVAELGNVPLLAVRVGFKLLAGESEVLAALDGVANLGSA